MAAWVDGSPFSWLTKNTPSPVLSLRRMERHRGVRDSVLAVRSLCSSLRDKHTNSYCSAKDFPAEYSRKNSGLLLPVQLLASCVTWGTVVSVSVPQGSSGF